MNAMAPQPDEPESVLKSGLTNHTLAREMRRNLTLVLILLLAACSDREDTRNANSDSKKPAAPELRAPELRVAVLGGDTGSAFVEGLRSAGVTNAQACSGETVAERAKLLTSADVALILVDATQGPLPINREDVLLTRQFCRGPVVVGFSRSASIDDPELLELEELELRELLNAYQLPGDTATMCFDSEQARTKHPKGFSAIAGLLSKLKPVDQASASESLQAAEASVYALADLESFKRGMARPIESGTFRVVFGHHEVDAALQAGKAVQPASSGVVSIRLPEPLDLPPGARFVITSQEHVIAAGTIAEFKQ